MTEYTYSSETLARLGQNEKLLDSMAAAFGLVACSDAVLEHMETSRFFEIARAEDRLSSLPWDHVKTRFEEITRDIMKGDDKARQRARDLVAASRPVESHREIILNCAQIAVVANLKLQPVEERALREVCDALGVDPSEQ